MKRLFCLLLATILLFSLAACEKDQEPSLNSGETAGENTGSNEENNTGENNETPNDKENPDENPDTGSSNTPAGGDENTSEQPKITYVTVRKEHISHGKTTSLEIFDTRGNLLKKVSGTPNTWGSYTYTYTYDENNNCVTKVYEEYGFPPDTTTYTYDEKGNKLTSHIVRGNGSWSKTNYRYNEAGLLEQKTTSDEIGTNTIIVYAYDENGNLLQEVLRYPHSETISSTRYTYDSRGNRLSTSHYQGETCEYEIRWTYDAAGNKLSEIDYFYDGDQVIHKTPTQWAYDDHGNVTGVLHSPDLTAQIPKQNENTYDALGNILSSTTFHADGTISSRVEFTYDRHGNILTTASYDANGNLVGRGENTYTEDGKQLTHQGYDRNGAGCGSERFVYDEAGNLLSKTTYDRQDNIIHQSLYAYEAVVTVEE